MPDSQDTENVIDDIRLIQKNHIIVDTKPVTAGNAPLEASAGRSLKSDIPVMFRPYEHYETYNSWYNPELEPSPDLDFPKYRQNKYGFVSAVLSYATANYWKNGYTGDKQFWAGLNSNLNGVMLWKPCGNHNDSAAILFEEQTFEAMADRTIVDSALTAFHEYAVLSGYAQQYNVKIIGHESSPVLLDPGWTGESGYPVGLVFQRNVFKNSQNLNNFGIFAFIIGMPVVIENGSVYRGISFGKEILNIGSGLSVEVSIYRTSSDLTSQYPARCGFVAARATNAFNPSDARSLSKLFGGNATELELAYAKEALSGTRIIVALNCIHHSIVDFSKPENRSGVFFFDTPLSDSSTTEIFVCMRPSDITGGGTDFPPESNNSYGNDENYLGRFAIIPRCDSYYLV